MFGDAKERSPRADRESLRELVVALFDLTASRPGRARCLSRSGVKGRSLRGASLTAFVGAYRNGRNRVLTPPAGFPGPITSRRAISTRLRSISRLIPCVFSDSKIDERVNRQTGPRTKARMVGRHAMTSHHGSE